MSKKRLNSEITIEKARVLCIRHDIKIYPVYRLGFWYIEVEQNGRKRRFDKEIGRGNTLSSKKPNTVGINWLEAIDSTYLHYAAKILENERKLNKDGTNKGN